MYVLYKIKLSKFNNLYRIEPDLVYRNMGAKVFTINCDNDISIKRFLRRCKAADSTENPRSKRFLTYDQILSNLGQKGFLLYIFAHNYPKDDIEFNKIIGD